MHHMRVYALSGPNGTPERCGILVYTATAGAQVTPGGLVGTAPRFTQILEGALERSMICSNDPICADHQPGHHGGDRATHGAACHGCLIAETSCEMRNLFLDRNLLVPTMAMNDPSFFGRRYKHVGRCRRAIGCELFNQNDRLVWLDEGSLVPVNRDILLELIPKHVSVKKLVNRDGRWERELCPFVPDDMTLSALLSGMSPMRSATGILLPGGGLLGRVPKA
jgi:hypothetical protein